MKQTLLAPHMMILYLLIIITAIGAMLRLHKLGRPSLGNDEASSILDSRGKLYNISHPPLSYVILRLFVETLGTNEFTIRLPSCLFGIATIPLIYFFGKQLFSEKEGLVASFLISVSPWHIYWSQQARMYTELAVFTLLALSFFYQTTYKETATPYVFSAIFTVLAFYTHYSAILILAILVFWLISKGFLRSDQFRLNYKYLTIFFGIFFILSSILFFTTILQTIEFKFGENTLRWGLPIDELFKRLVQSDLGIMLSVFSVAGALYLVLQKSSTGFLLTAYALIPLITFALLTFIISIDTRYIVFALPAYALLSAHLVTESFEKIRKSESKNEFRGLILNLDKNKILAFGFLFAIVLSVNNLYTFYFSYYRYKAHADWKSACAYVENHMTTEDLIAATGDKAVYYYLGKIDFNLSIELFKPGTFDEIKNANERVWLLISGTLGAIDPDAEFRDWIANHCKLMKTKNQISIYLFTP
ncbi:glycosyltransferase family 39 protein [Candidatus Borrarchaeum sp.]|uniref:glycosyltransferase family 39 protein n=1 Tax=Candidatus Borrarchaeum sp. TaxID=2846742 RepID=UPI00257E32EE|nr:glycosyltransferase family 39 protein [Candidatus Borrarchaeum sp.]